MKIYTYSEARQRLATLLDQSRREGRVQIRRRDGQLYVLQPVDPSGSPLDVPAVSAGLRRGELQELVREGRRGGDRYWKGRPQTRRAPPKRARTARARARAETGRR